MVWSVRSIARVGLVLLLAVVAGSRLVGAWFWWRQYLEWRASDSSGAEASLTFAEFDIGVAVLSIAGAWVAWTLFRLRGGGPPPATMS
jgi:hypothetical protein